MKTYSAPAYFIATMLLEIHFAALVLVSNKLPYWFLFAIKLLTAHASSVFAWLCLMPLKSHIKCSGGSHACLKMPHGCAPYHIRHGLPMWTCRHTFRQSLALQISSRWFERSRSAERGSDSTFTWKEVPISTTCKQTFLVDCSLTWNPHYVCFAHSCWWKIK